MRNAQEATPEAGEVTVSAGTADGTAHVAIRDTGCGMTADVKERLFEPFFTTKGDRGLGLGLDISKKIIEAHGGSLTFESRVGAGTTFRIALPVPSD